MGAYTAATTVHKLSARSAGAAEKERYEKAVEQWNQENEDDQLVFNKAGVAVRKAKSRAVPGAKERREAELAAKREASERKCVPAPLFLGSHRNSDTAAAAAAAAAAAVVAAS